MLHNLDKQGNLRLTFIGLAGLGIASIVIIVIGVSTLSGQVAGAVVAGLGAVMASVLSITVSKHWERRLDIEQEHRRQKIPVYEDFLASWFTGILAAKRARIGEPHEEPSFLFKFGIKIMLWGSDEVVREYSSVRRNLISVMGNLSPSAQGLTPKLPFSQSGSDVASSMENLFLKIRADVGHKNEGLKRGDLLSVMFDVKEIDSVMGGEKR